MQGAILGKCGWIQILDIVFNEGHGILRYQVIINMIYYFVNDY